MKKVVKLILYRQGNDWLVNEDGYVHQLQIGNVSKESIKRYYKAMDAVDGVHYVLNFN